MPRPISSVQMSTQILPLRKLCTIRSLWINSNCHRKINVKHCQRFSEHTTERRTPLAIRRTLPASVSGQHELRRRWCHRKRARGTVPVLVPWIEQRPASVAWNPVRHNILKMTLGYRSRIETLEKLDTNLRLWIASIAHEIGMDSHFVTSIFLFKILLQRINIQKWCVHCHIQSNKPNL